MSSINKAMAAFNFANKEKASQNKKGNSPKQNNEANSDKTTADKAPNTLNQMALAFASAGQINKNTSEQNQTTENSPAPTSDKPNANLIANPKPSFSRVDLSIAGTPHRISCPSDEVANLNKTAETLNDNLRKLRGSINGKNPNNEELLVLHCLELYDQISELQKQCEHYQSQEQDAHKLLDTLLKNAQAIL